MISFDKLFFLKVFFNILFFHRWLFLFQHKDPSSAVVPQDILHSLCASVIHSGREYSRRNNSPCPLMYAYYQTEYLGK